MAQINRQVRQPALHLSALSIPGDETVDGKGMAQVMNPRLIASAVNSTDVRSLSDPGEIRLKGHNVNRPSSSRREERRAAALWVASTLTSCSVVRQGFHQLWPQRYHLTPA